MPAASPRWRTFVRTYFPADQREIVSPRDHTRQLNVLVEREDTATLVRALTDADARR